jgi:thioredoxin-like negative regulator of GroEL
MKKLALLILAFTLLSFTTVINVEFINSNNFDNKIGSGVNVVEYWAGWNQSNQFNDLEKLKECDVYRVDIGTHMDLQSKNKIKAIPTVVIYNNGVEVKRFEPNVMFTLEVGKKEIQASVDSVVLSKFQ